MSDNKREETEVDQWELQAGIMFYAHKRTKEVRYRLIAKPGELDEEGTERARRTVGSAFRTFADTIRGWGSG